MNVIKKTELDNCRIPYCILVDTPTHTLCLRKTLSSSLPSPLWHQKPFTARLRDAEGAV